MKRLLSNPSKLLFAAALFNASCGAAGWANLTAHAQSPPRRPARKAAPAEQKSSHAQPLAAGLTEGIAALERGDLAAAKLFFERALAADPRSVEAHTYLGVLADRAGDLKEAEKHFAAAAMNAPFLPSARNNHGAILLRLGRTAQATAQFEASLKLAPNQPSALINLAQIHSDAGTPGQLNRARELFSRAQAIAPDLSVARALIAIALRLGDAAAAKGYYRDYQSLAAATSAAAAAPSGTDGASSHAALGAALLSAGLAGEAVVELTAAHALAPTDTDVIVRLASAHLAQGDVPAAGRTLEAAVARGLDTAPIYAALAEVYVKSDHIENAIPAMRLAIERDPKNETYRFRYGMLLTDTKAPAAAVIRLQEALQEFPGSSRLWFALGVAQTALDKPEEAAKSFERARELDPKFAPALAYLGMTYDHQGRYADAVRLYEQALKLDDRLAAAHYLAAEATLKQPSANTASAEVHLARAVSLDPSFAPARLSLAKLYLAADRMDEAIVHLQSAVATDPNLAEAHYHLGRALKRLKRDAESQVALATFKRLSEEKREQKRNEPREIMRRLANVRF